MKEGDADQLLYNPIEDELNEHMHKDKSLQLSCAGCFSAIAYTNEHDCSGEKLFESDYAVPMKHIAEQNVQVD